MFTYLPPSRAEKVQSVSATMIDETQLLCLYIILSMFCIGALKYNEW